MVSAARLRTWLFALLLVLLLAVAPTAGQPTALTILHFNDDYQLAAVDGGKAGGLDRLAAPQHRGDGSGHRDRIPKGGASGR